jgi:hypothetical protein
MTSEAVKEVKGNVPRRQGSIWQIRDEAFRAVPHEAVHLDLPSIRNSTKCLPLLSDGSESPHAPSPAEMKEGVLCIGRIREC